MNINNTPIDINGALCKLQNNTKIITQKLCCDCPISKCLIIRQLELTKCFNLAVVQQLALLECKINKCNCCNHCDHTDGGTF